MGLWLISLCALVRVPHELQSFWKCPLCCGLSPSPLAFVFPLCCFSFSLSVSSVFFPFMNMLSLRHHILLMGPVLACREAIISGTNLFPQKPPPLWGSRSIPIMLQVSPCTCNSASSFGVDSGKTQFYSNLRVLCEGKMWRRAWKC